MEKLKQQVVGCLMVAGLVALGGCKGTREEVAAKESLPVVQVGVQPVREEQIGARMEVVGTVQAVERASISPRVSGQIVELPVVLGSQVKKGELLARISVAEIQARVSQAQAQLEQARRNLAREEKLQQQGASTRETVKSLQEQLRIAEAAYKEASTMLEYATITAPFTGTVTRKVASVGDLASPGSALLEMENNHVLQVVAQVPEGLILKVHKGDTLVVSIPALALELNGEVAEVAPAADPSSRTAPVKINIESVEGLRPGQFARVMVSGEDGKALMVNEKAIQLFGQMERIFLVDQASKTARLRLVRTGSHVDGQVEILSGVAAGDQVVVSGAERLRDGQPLDVQLIASPKKDSGRP